MNIKSYLMGAALSLIVIPTLSMASFCVRIYNFTHSPVNAQYNNVTNTKLNSPRASIPIPPMSNGQFLVSNTSSSDKPTFRINGPLFSITLYYMREMGYPYWIEKNFSQNKGAQIVQAPDMGEGAGRPDNSGMNLCFYKNNQQTYPCPQRAPEC